MKILTLDTSTSICFVALFNQKEFSKPIVLEDARHSSRDLFPSIKKLLQLQGLSPKDLNAIAVGTGPGFFTGIRIAISCAQTLAYSLNIPLIPFCSLAPFSPSTKGSFITIANAKNGTYFVYQDTLQTLTTLPPSDIIISTDDTLSDHPLYQKAQLDLARLIPLLFQPSTQLEPTYSEF